MCYFPSLWRALVRQSVVGPPTQGRRRVWSTPVYRRPCEATGSSIPTGSVVEQEKLLCTSGVHPRRKSGRITVALVREARLACPRGHAPRFFHGRRVCARGECTRASVDFTFSAQRSAGMASRPSTSPALNLEEGGSAERHRCAPPGADSS